MDDFENLEKSIFKYSALGEIIFCGDFNAKTGNLHDFSHVDPYVNEGNSSEHSVSKRFSKDVITNHDGKLLVKLCIENELVTLNGRTKGDLVGSFTCNTYNGSSVVHYDVVSHNLLPLINSFLVN